MKVDAQLAKGGCSRRICKMRKEQRPQRLQKRPDQGTDSSSEQGSHEYTLRLFLALFEIMAMGETLTLTQLMTPEILCILLNGHASKQRLGFSYRHLIRIPSYAP